MFKIEDIDSIGLARVINKRMLREQPQDWLTYLEKYIKTDIIIINLLEGNSAFQITISVLLKNIS
jgi:hypothetical protein